MMPGGLDPKRMKALMKQMGIEQEDLKGVTEVIIRTKTKELYFREPQVLEVRAQGSRTFQVVGKPEERAPGSSTPVGPAKGREQPPEPSEFPEEDVRLVMDQAGCSREKAVAALRSADGSPAEAILSLMA